MFCPLMIVVYVSNLDRIFHICNGSKNVTKPKFRIFCLRLVFVAYASYNAYYRYVCRIELIVVFREFFPILSAYSQETIVKEKKHNKRTKHTTYQTILFDGNVLRYTVQIYRVLHLVTITPCKLSTVPVGNLSSMPRAEGIMRLWN